MKTFCPSHEDTNPSLHVYGDGSAYCFVCGYVEKPNSRANSPDHPWHKKKSNIEDTNKYIDYIESLPKKNIRGIDLPSNNFFYFILWPDKSFYKKRTFDCKQGSKYIGPKGKQPPLFNLSLEGDKLVVVEGELNALSLAKVIPKGYNIVSPGSVTQLSKFIDFYLTYRDITIIVDKDVAGVAYGSELRYLLSSRGVKVRLIAMSEDYNDILQQRGIQGVKETFQRDMAL